MDIEIIFNTAYLNKNKLGKYAMVILVEISIVMVIMIEVVLKNTWLHFARHRGVLGIASRSAYVTGGQDLDYYNYYVKLMA